MANSRFARGDLKARLWDISWIARNKFWFAVAPITYAVSMDGHDSTGKLRRAYAQPIWRLTTAKTNGIVSGCGPHSFRTCSV